MDNRRGLGGIGETTMEFRSIHPHGGDRRAAFEELSYQLFAREFASRGVPFRREGAGGDAGLEGGIVDGANEIVIGLQAKFFIDSLGKTQWRDLDRSIRTALKDNAGDAGLGEIVVTIPRNLTKAQQGRWDDLRMEWRAEATRLGYGKAVAFTLWNASRLEGLLLQAPNRGLLLHYFELADFDVARCHQKTRATIRGLGDRYRPDLHTSTEAEDTLHTFLRSERCRQQFLEAARTEFKNRWMLPRPSDRWPSELLLAHEQAEAAWQRVVSLLGDGASLPKSFAELAQALEAASAACRPVIEGLRRLIPEREKDSTGEPAHWHPRSPAEEEYDRYQRWAHRLSSLREYVRERTLADARCLLLTGEPGTGKTHVLAEICARYADQGGVVVFAEGAAFTSGDPPWVQLLRWCDFPGANAEEFLDVLSAIAQSTPLPALICIDALNETPDRGVWHGHLVNFSDALSRCPNVKLLVSCRSDYLQHTVPEAIRSGQAPGWVTAEHRGLGVNVFEAMPKYLRAYGVKGVGMPPLTFEFQVPLFLKVFCEAHADRAVEPGTLSLGSILRQYVTRKSETLGSRIDCEPGRVADALRDLASEMAEAHALQMPAQRAREICDRHHTPTQASRSLYRGLLSESVLAEIPGPGDALGSTYLVRFTYERVWDYFLSLQLLPEDKAPTEALMARLRDGEWRQRNGGVLSLFMIRFAEEGHGEIPDLLGEPDCSAWDVVQAFLASLPWRTHQSASARTWELFRGACRHLSREQAYSLLLRAAPSPAHPWNARWLHRELAGKRVASRDQTWTLWVNEELTYLPEGSALVELFGWAERGHLELVSDEQRVLLAMALAWCLSTTVVNARIRLAGALTRVLAGRTSVAVEVVREFLPVDDPYVLERVLLAGAGAAQHADEGDPGLRDLASIVHEAIFSGETVPPHLLIREYAAEICRQAHEKDVLSAVIDPASFRPPYRSRWPEIWSQDRVRQQEESIEKPCALFHSVEPGNGFGYGDWGRYVMQAHVRRFYRHRVGQPPETGDDPDFDAQIAKRYVIQRIFEMGWDPSNIDQRPSLPYAGRGQPRVERISKKYQWIALYEFLGFLSDHYQYHGYDDEARKFETARQLEPENLLDPFVVSPLPDEEPASWDFVRPPSPWWRGGLDPLPRPLGPQVQRRVAAGRKMGNPAALMDVFDGQTKWLALSAFHRWNEPVPVWVVGMSPTHLSIEWAVRSYLVPDRGRESLIRHLGARGIDHSRHWLQEPDFAQPLVALRKYPLDQEDLRSRCDLENIWETRDWDTGACCTTCRCSPDLGSERAKAGSIPSPQLGEIGALRWLRRAYDFASGNGEEVVVKHVGEGFDGACLVQRDALIDWLDRADMHIVWRCFCFKNRMGEHGLGETNARTYWSAYTLDRKGRLICCGGATGILPDGAGPEEPLPWTVRRFGPRDQH